MSTASAARAICAASIRSRRACSAWVAVTVAVGSAARSAVRRVARAISLAVRKTLTTASGATTVPMSRPSATIPRPSARARAMISRCMAISRARTCGTRATADTAPDTSRVRIAADTSRPSTVTHGSSGSVPTSMTGPSDVPRHRVRVIHRDAVGQQPPGQGAVHGAGVEIAEAEGARRPARGARFARRRRTVDGDDDSAAR